MSRRSRPQYRSGLGWILGVAFPDTLTGRLGLLRGSLTFGAAVRLGLLPHTASRRQPWRLTTAGTACSCLWLAVATTSPREGLSPPIQYPCQAHLRSGSALPSTPPRRHSNPDCRAVLILIVARHGVCSRRLTWRLCGLGQLVLDLAFRLPRAPENRTRFKAPGITLPFKPKSPLT